MRVPLLSALVALAGAVLLDWYIFNDIRRHCRSSLRKMWLWVYAVSSVLFWLLLIVVLLWPKRNPDVSVDLAMWMLYVFASTYTAKAVYSICSLIGRGVARLLKRRWNGGVPAGIVLACVAFAVMWWGAAVTRHTIDVQRMELVSPKLPEAFNGFTIAQFSDAHLGTWGNDTTFASALVDTVNTLRPDLIVFTGDVVNRQSSELKPFVGILSRLKAPYGVIAILGNHDYSGYVDWRAPSDSAADHRKLIDMERSAGWDLLLNENRVLHSGNDSIIVIGVENWGEPPFGKIGDLKASYPTSKENEDPLNDGNFKILLSHNPSHWVQEAIMKSNIDLTLSGHTHAMQFEVRAGKLKWSPCDLRYKEWGGKYVRNNFNGIPMTLYVNIGCGEVAFPARVGAVPEITLITLRRGHVSPR